MPDAQTIHVLLIDRPAEGAAWIQNFRSEPGQWFPCKVKLATSFDQAFQMLQLTDFDVAILSQAIADEDCDGVDLSNQKPSNRMAMFDQLRAFDRRLPIIVLSDQRDDHVAIAAIESGAQDFLIRQNQTHDELVDAIRFAIIRERKVIELKVDAETDPLTGLANRRNLANRFSDLLNRTINKGQSMSMALIDLDHFKAINDRSGHFVGDLVLKFVGQQLSQFVDGPMQVSRLGGEEFAILMPDCSLRLAVQKADAILQSLESKPIDTTDKSVTVTASAGVINVLSTDSWQSAFIACDRLLLEAKSAGRNRLKSRVRSKDVDDSVDAPDNQVLPDSRGSLR